MKKEQHAEARDALGRAVVAAQRSPRAHHPLCLAFAQLGETASPGQQVEAYREALGENEKRRVELRAKTGLAGAARP